MANKNTLQHQKPSLKSLIVALLILVAGMLIPLAIDLSNGHLAQKIVGELEKKAEARLGTDFQSLPYPNDNYSSNGTDERVECWNPWSGIGSSGPKYCNYKAMITSQSSEVTDTIIEQRLNLREDLLRDGWKYYNSGLTTTLRKVTNRNSESALICDVEMKNIRNSDYLQQVGCSWESAFDANILIIIFCVMLFIIIYILWLTGFLSGTSWTSRTMYISATFIYLVFLSRGFELLLNNISR
jgi:hypothetical protein